MSSNQKELPSYSIAYQTVQSLLLLEKNQDRLTRENLTVEVKNLTGLDIHAVDNYRDLTDFKTAILSMSVFLKGGYQQAQTEEDQLKFFRYGLCGNLTPSSCFEIRYETLYHFYEQSQTLVGNLKFQVQDLNRNKGVVSLTAVEEQELREFLMSNNFFDRHSITEDAFQDAVLELRKAELISSEESRKPSDIINEIYSNYDKFGFGLDQFLTVVSQDPLCSGWDNKTCVDHVEDYFELYPERKIFL
ncbi:MAG: hypothetical protein ACH350_07465 [Parachlamydiaceae bacterium]